MKQQKTVRYDENFKIEFDDDNEWNNVWKLPSRKYNLASLLWAPEPSEQRYEPLSLGRDAIICKTVIVALGNSDDVVIRLASDINGLPSIHKKFILKLFFCFIKILPLSQVTFSRRTRCCPVKLQENSVSSPTETRTSLGWILTMMSRTKKNLQDNLLSINIKRLRFFFFF